jgi:hypothetical protein
MARCSLFRLILVRQIKFAEYADVFVREANASIFVAGKQNVVSGGFCIAGHALQQAGVGLGPCVELTQGWICEPQRNGGENRYNQYDLAHDVRPRWQPRKMSATLPGRSALGKQDLAAIGLPARPPGGGATNPSRKSHATSTLAALSGNSSPKQRW